MNIFYELIGYAASLFLAISLMVQKDVQFRIINSLGCIFFVVYGILIQSWPLVLTNSLLFGINMFYLYKLYNRREDFSVVNVSPQDAMVSAFISYYKNDFEKYYPAYNASAQHADVAFFVLRDMNLANLFIARKTGQQEAEVIVNYTIPRYRDFKVGKYLFQTNTHELLSRGIRQISYQTVENNGHRDFLKRMGFETDGTGRYEKAIS